MIHQAAFALDVAARVIPIYETVFDVEYPLPKLDTLVVGRRISIGAVFLTLSLCCQASDFDAGKAPLFSCAHRIEYSLPAGAMEVRGL